MEKQQWAMGIKWGWKTFLDLDYADDLVILVESMSKIDKLLEVLRVQGARINLKMNVKKAMAGITWRWKGDIL